VRWIVRAPVWLYRVRLGFLLGSRLLMIEHTGRRTGARRYVILEAVDRPGPRTYIVAAGFGERAQWLRNVRANPAVRVYTGGRRPAPAIARLLDHEESAAALTAYARSHPRAWAALRPVFETTLGARIGSDGTSLPMIALDLTSTSR
jgi:deazaflavin-dependent oxidoreductase (nitroreductase family)